RGAQHQPVAPPFVRRLHHGLPFLRHPPPSAAPARRHGGAAGTREGGGGDPPEAHAPGGGAALPPAGEGPSSARVSRPGTPAPSARARGPVPSPVQPR